MNVNRQRNGVFILALLAIGCPLISSCSSTQLSPEGQRVRVVESAETLSGCKLLGDIENKSHLTAKDGVNQLRNKTAAVGGDTVLLTTFGIRRGHAGMAYSCTPSTP